MALYWEDWSNETIGAISAPAGWTRRWDTGNANLSIVADASAPSGKALRIVKAATDCFLLSWDAVDSDSDRADCEILALVRIQTTGVMDTTNILGCTARASGNDTAETGYMSNLAFAGTSPVIMNRRIVIYQNGTTVGTPLTVAVDTFANTQGGLYWVKFRCEGTSITVAVMPYGGAWSEESTVDSTVTAAGWVGIFSLSLNASVDILAVSVATDGDYATLPDPEPHVFKTELIAIGGYVNLGQPEVLNNLVARTYMAYMRPTGVQNPGYLFVKAGNDGVGGPRVQISNTNMNVALVTPTSGSNLVPTRTTVNTSLAYNAWTHHAVTWDGVSACNTQAQWYIDGAAVSENQSAGSSPYLDGAGYDFRLFNRGDLVRTCLGSFAYMVIWNRELSEAEIAQAYADGPLSVPDGLVLCWANGRDYGPNALTPTARSTFAAGVRPPNINLGSVAVVEGDLAVTETGVDVFFATDVVANSEGDLAATEAADVFAASGVVVVPTMALATSEDSMNLTDVAHPVSPTTITNPTTSTPTVNAYVRVIYTAWRNFYGKFTGVSGRRPLFKIMNPDDCVSSFQTNWRPWYSYDGINWLRFDTAPVNNTTSWDFQHSVAFTQDTVYIGYQPAWPVWRAPWLIGQLQALDADLVHELPSSPGFEYPTTMTAQLNELGVTVPGQKMYAFGIWDDTLTPLDGSPKRIMIVSGGIHAGEHVGSWAMEGFLRYLFSGDSYALNLLRHFKFFVYPMANPMGRYMGHYRGQRNPGYLTLDPNRDWPIDSSPSNLQSSQFLRNMLEVDIGANRAAFSLDFHGTWGGSGTDAHCSYFYYDGDSVYGLRFQEATESYDSYFSGKVSTVIPDTTFSGGIQRLCGNGRHIYTPELYEASAFTQGTDTLLGVGRYYAQGVSRVATYAPETLKFPSAVFTLSGSTIIGGIHWNWS